MKLKLKLKLKKFALILVITIGFLIPNEAFAQDGKRYYFSKTDTSDTKITEVELTLPNETTPTTYKVYQNGTQTVVGTRVTDPANIQSNVIYNVTSTEEGAAIYNNSLIEDSIIADFINNSAGGDGGAISNRATINNSIVGDFIGNYSKSDGGAIYNSGLIRNINGNFTSNHTVANGNGNGGAIYNMASINSIIGDFISNSSDLDGGAIYNGGGIDSIKGNFIGNYSARGDGGAIYNMASINNSIVGNFIGNHSDGRGGGAIYNNGFIHNINGDFTSNHSFFNGGAIYNTLSTIDSITGNFNGNYTANPSGYGGGAIANMNSSIIHNITGNFIGNHSDGGAGGAIDNRESSIHNITGDFIGNYAEGGAGAIVNENQGTINSIVGNFINNHSSDLFGGAIANIIDSIIYSITGNFIGNYTSGVIGGGAIYNQSELTLNATSKDILFYGNYVSNSDPLGGAIYNKSMATLNINAGAGHKISFIAPTENLVAGAKYDTIYNAGTIDINQNTSDTGTIVLGTELGGIGNVNLNRGTLQLTNAGSITNEVNLNLLGGTLHLANNSINTLNMNSLTISGTTNLIADVNVSTGVMDTISANTITATDKINVSGINTIGTLTGKSVSADFVHSRFGNTNLMGHVTTSVKDIQTPILKWGVYYEEDTANNIGRFIFAQKSSDEYSNFNPAVMASPIAAQVGSYLTQINSYEQAFGNYDMLMALPKSVRQAMKYANKYASADQGTGAGGVITFDPNQIPEQGKGLWFRPFATFENVGLKNGPTVGNVAYGSLFGGDSDIIKLSHGWDAIYSAYAGYNGSHQTYDGVGVYQNGGQLGLSALFYKGNFFTGLTANVGANVGEANTMYGNDSFTMLATGIASKTGYNLEFKEGKFIIQPNFLMSYTFVNTFDYTNAAGVSIQSDPLNAIQIAPGIKFIGNLKNGWQPYASIQMVWNIMDQTKFSANDVSLPEMSVKPYIQYGIGLQKRWGERFTAFCQAMIRNGGRNGIALQLGFRWALGKV